MESKYIYHVNGLSVGLIIKIIMVYCRVSNKVRFFIYNIYNINLHYKSKKIIIIKYTNMYIYKNKKKKIECIYVYSCVCCLRFLI